MGQTASHLNGVGNQLIKASKAGDADAVTELVSTNPQLLRYCTFRHLGPCHYAARGDHVEVLHTLVAKAQEVEQLQWQAAAASGAKVHARLVGAPPAAQQPGEQASPTVRGNAPCSLVKQLVNAASDRGVTPLMLAVDGGCIASVRLLLEKGADPWAVDKLGGRTALHYASRGNKPEILQLLVEAAGSSGPVHFPNRPNTSYVDVRTQTGFTAVHFAVQSNSQETLAMLLSMDANPLLSSLFDCLDTINCPKGTTALHLAARQGNEAVAKQLLRAYVERWYHRHLPDPRLLMDGDNFLPCQIAARRNHEAVARMLLPSNPITSLFGEGDLHLLGPPTLAAIAGAVLRATLAGDLGLLMQQAQLEQQEQQEQEQPHSSTDEADIGAEPAAVPAKLGEQRLEGGEEAEAELPAAAPASALESVKAVEAASAEADGDWPAALAASSVGSAGSVGDQVCGVCFDAPTQVSLAPCGHQLCVGCCKSLLELNSRCVMACPFCRGGVGHLTPVCQPVQAYGAVAAAAAAAAAPLLPEPAVALTSNRLVL